MTRMSVSASSTSFSKIDDFFVVSRKLEYIVVVVRLCERLRSKKIRSYMQWLKNSFSFHDR